MPEVLKIKKLYPDAKIHTAYTLGAIDLCKQRFVGPFTNSRSVVIGTGIAVEIPADHVGLVFSRSGQGFNYDVRLANSVGVIDADYRGEVLVKLTADSPQGLEYLMQVANGCAIAQMLVIKKADLVIEFVNELSETQRGDKGFGSSDKKEAN